MKRNMIFLMFGLLWLGMGFAQHSEEEVLKKIALKETEMFQNRNVEGWRTLFNQDSNSTRYLAGNGYYFVQKGWKSIDSIMNVYMAYSSLRKSTINNSNYIIEVGENVAWMVYDQQIKFESDSIGPTGSKEFRTFIKSGNQWKISSVMTLDTLSYLPTTNPEIIENLFNETGYNFLAENKVDEAIEIFKLNVKLYPNAWNTYDSLGEAYATSGNKELAIENYKKSLELNPENDNGKEWLERLKN